MLLHYNFSTIKNVKQISFLSKFYYKFEKMVRKKQPTKKKTKKPTKKEQALMKIIYGSMKTQGKAVKY